MLFMIVEHFRDRDPIPVYQRFRDRGRLAPDGLTYVSSWVSETLDRCFQIMETDDPRLLDEWIAAWSDIVDFEVIPVLSSAAAAERVASEEAIHTDGSNPKDVPLNLIDSADPAFQNALAAIESGDVRAVEQIVVDNPGLLRDRIDTGDEGYFRHPYLLWFVAENPVRTGALPANIASVARAVIDAAVRLDVEDWQSQIDYALGLVASGRIPRECGVQDKLIDVFCDAGADPNGPLVAALVHRERGATERLLARGARLTLFAAACLGRLEDLERLLPDAQPSDRQGALTGAALYGNAEALKLLVERGVDVSAYSPNWVHPHATALHHAVDSGNLDAVRFLVDSGAPLDVRDRVYQGTPLDWAEHLGRSTIAFYLQSVTQAPEPAASAGATSQPRARSLVAMASVADVSRSIVFYEKLGFAAPNTFTPDGTSEIAWAWLFADPAQLMLSRASGPINPSGHSVLFYVYVDDVASMKTALESAGVAAGAIAFPFYAPRGEFSITDPDGYTIMVTHT